MTQIGQSSEIPRPSRPPLDEVIALLCDAIDIERIRLGRQRQAAVWRGETPDYLPLLLGHTPLNAGGCRHNRRWMMAEHQLTGGPVTEELESYPHYDLLEMFDDPAKMLYEQLWEMVAWARAGSDAQLSVRNGFLVWAIASAFGIKPDFDAVQMPWGNNHLARNQLETLSIHGMEHRGLLPRSLEFMEFFNRHLPPHVRQYVPDLSGPLSLANYLFGNDWFWMAFYDDPEFVHKALDFCAKAHTYMGKLYKKSIGEKDNESYHGALYMAGGGIKVVDDSNVNLSADQWREFDMPRIARCFETFGGGWYHSCGYYPEKLDLLLEIPRLTAINFGNPEMWDQDDAAARIVGAGKVYYGGWVRKTGETLEDCLRRAVKIAGPKRRGLIIMLKDDEERPLPHHEEIMALWHRLQDEGTD